MKNADIKISIFLCNGCDILYIVCIVCHDIFHDVFWLSNLLYKIMIIVKNIIYIN